MPCWPTIFHRGSGDLFTDLSETGGDRPYGMRGPRKRGGPDRGHGSCTACHAGRPSSTGDPAICLPTYQKLEVTGLMVCVVLAKEVDPTEDMEAALHAMLADHLPPGIRRSVYRPIRNWR